MNLSKVDLDYITGREERLYELRDEIKTTAKHLAELQEERRIIALEFYDFGYTAYSIAKMAEVSETSVARWLKEED